MRSLRIAVGFARRELRGGLAGFRIFLACLALGVAAIAGIGSIAASVVGGLAADGRVLLGGDVSIRTIHQPIKPDARRWLAGWGRLSTTIRMRSMARSMDGARRALIDLKTIDDAYPLYGVFELDRGNDRKAVFARGEGIWGAAAERGLLERLGLAVGQRIRVGDALYEIRAVVENEPDKVGGTRAITLGPRVIISEAGLLASGLIRPGAQVRYYTRLRLADGATLAGFHSALTDRFPDAGWRVRDRTRATPGVQRFVERTTQFLTLVGLTALLIGGVGAGNAVRAYLAGKTATIATLKCVGATGRIIFQTYLLQVGVMAALGILIGLVLGAALPIAASAALAEIAPTPLRLGFYPVPLLLAASFGVLTAAAFALWPIARACETPPGSLFRNLIAPSRARPKRGVALAVALSVITMAALAVITAQDRIIAIWFVVGAAVALVIFHLAGRGVMRLAARARHGRAMTRLALANLHRPGAQTANVVLSMGLGLTVLVAVVVVQGNIERQISDTLPERAPAYYFIDIQPDQVAPFERVVRGVPGVEAIQRTPMLRGRITAIDGTPVEQAKVAQNVRWVVRNDRGLTWAAKPPEGTRLIEGEWWPADYTGPPLISLHADTARGFGIGVGDTLTVNVLGRAITARIASLREIDWGSFRLNFVIVFSPGVIETAPQTHIATVHVDAASEEAVGRAIADKFGNITAIRVRDVLRSLSQIMERIAGAVRLTASITVLAGVLVLGGAVAAGNHRRIYDSVVLKVLGARRHQIIGAFLMEFGLMAAATVLIAALAGSAAAWAILTQVMRASWAPMPGTVVVTMIFSIVAIMALALAGTWRALGRKAAPLLRNE
ncbi:MAG: FtsX-like permease family protein [Alphaproteobacteria bacterium]